MIVKSLGLVLAAAGRGNVRLLSKQKIKAGDKLTTDWCGTVRRYTKYQATVKHKTVCAIAVEDFKLTIVGMYTGEAKLMPSISQTSRRQNETAI